MRKWFLNSFKIYVVCLRPHKNQMNNIQSLRNLFAPKRPNKPEKNKRNEDGIGIELTSKDEIFA